ESRAVRGERGLRARERARLAAREVAHRDRVAVHRVHQVPAARRGHDVLVHARAGHELRRPLAVPDLDDRGPVRLPAREPGDVERSAVRRERDVDLGQVLRPDGTLAAGRQVLHLDRRLERLQHCDRARAADQLLAVRARRGQAFQIVVRGLERRARPRRRRDVRGAQAVRREHQSAAPDLAQHAGRRARDVDDVRAQRLARAGLVGDQAAVRAELDRAAVRRDLRRPVQLAGEQRDRLEEPLAARRLEQPLELRERLRVRAVLPVHVRGVAQLLERDLRDRRGRRARQARTQQQRQRAGILHRSTSAGTLIVPTCPCTGRGRSWRKVDDAGRGPSREDRMIREHVFRIDEGGEPWFRWRGGEVSRTEALADMVFAFGITLLVVSLEVPASFDELFRMMEDFAAFALCFALMLFIWHSHYKFFRRYGLEDTYTVLLNAILLFVVLFYLYPLKFLFTFLVGELLG